MQKSVSMSTGPCGLTRRAFLGTVAAFDIGWCLDVPHAMAQECMPADRGVLVDDGAPADNGPVVDENGHVRGAGLEFGLPPYWVDKVRVVPGHRGSTLAIVPCGFAPDDGPSHALLTFERAARSVARVRRCSGGTRRNDSRPTPLAAWDLPGGRLVASSFDWFGRLEPAVVCDAVPGARAACGYTAEEAMYLLDLVTGGCLDSSVVGSVSTADYRCLCRALPNLVCDLLVGTTVEG